MRIIILLFLTLNYAHADQADYPVNGYIQSLTFINNGSMLLAATQQGGKNGDPTKHGLNIYKVDAQGKLSKIGFMNLGFGRVVGAHNDIIAFLRPPILAYGSKLQDEYYPTLAIISIKNPSKPKLLVEDKINATKATLDFSAHKLAYLSADKLTVATIDNTHNISSSIDIDIKKNCIDPHQSELFQRVATLAFSNSAQSLHLMTEYGRICSYDVSDMNNATMFNRWSAGPGTLISQSDGRLLVMLGSEYGGTKIRKSAAVGNKSYALKDYYDAVAGFERNEYGNLPFDRPSSYQLDKSRLVINFHGDTVRVYDISDRNHPELEEEFTHRAKFGKIAISPDYRHVAVGHNEFFSLIDVGAANFPAPAIIKRKHSAALKAYRGNPTKAGAMRAIESLNELNVPRLLVVANPELSAKYQSHLLNDMAYFMLQSGSYKEAANYLERSLYFDNKRSTAYYNYLEVLEHLIPESKYGVRKALVALAQSYLKKYQQLTGKEYKSLSNYSFLPEENSSNVCDYIANAVEHDVLGRIIYNPKQADINSDGNLETLREEVVGTARVKSIYVYSTSDNPVYSPHGEYDWNGWLSTNLDIVPYSGNYYFLFHNAGIPVQLVHSDREFKEKVACRFSTSQELTLDSKYKNSRLCNDVFHGKVQYIEADTATQIDTPQPPARETHPGSHFNIDYDNDGDLDLLLVWQFASGGGAGCDAIWQDLIPPTYDKEASDLLLEVQGVDYNNAYPGQCGHMSTKWFTYDDNVYMDRTFRGVHRWTDQQNRIISLFKNNKVEKMCEFTYKWKIKYSD